jgi:hypothetical protein
MSESRTLRDRQRAGQEAFDASLDLTPPEGAAALLVQTTTLVTYPTTAAAFYACVPCEVNGAETEGGAASYVQQSGVTLYALNLGTAIPPSGTTLVAHAVGGRWVFRFDG